MRVTIASLGCSSLSQVTPHPARSGWSKRRQRATLSPRERAGTKNTSDSGPLPGGEGGERSEPGEGSFLFE
jgi:hypothetical protein